MTRFLLSLSVFFRVGAHSEQTMWLHFVEVTSLFLYKSYSRGVFWTNTKHSLFLLWQCLWLLALQPVKVWERIYQYFESCDNTHRPWYHDLVSPLKSPSWFQNHDYECGRRLAFSCTKVWCILSFTESCPKMWSLWYS